jgi:DNA-nicking Smr family endonuclease
MSKRRELDPGEHALWDEVTRSVKPARGKRPAKPRAEPLPKREPAKPLPRSQAHAKQPKRPPEPLKGLAPALMPGQPMPRESIQGVDGGTAERLRRGRITPDAVLDLHGLTQDRAYTTLLAFIRRHHADGHRCLLVITGKGSARTPTESDAKGFVMPGRSRAGVLRTLVPHWLNDRDLRAMVVGVQSAHQRHGGTGALYIYLRRKRS